MGGIFSIQKKRPLVSALLLGFFLFLISGGGLFLLWSESKSVQFEQIRSELLAVARSLQLQIDPSLHLKLKSRSQMEGEEYRKLIKPLAKIHRELPDLFYVYTGILVNDEVRLILDTMNEFSETERNGRTPSGIGDKYEQPNAAMIEALREGRQTVSTKPYQDEFGSFISAYVPIKDSNLTTIGVLGVDYSLDQVSKRLAAVERYAALLLLISLVLSALVGWFYFQRLRSQERAHAEMRNLSLIAKRTSNGVVLTNSKGEIEWVNEGFEKMTGYGLSEVRGKKPGHILQGAGTSSQTISEMREGLRTKEGFQTKILNYRKDKSPYWASVEVKPIFGPQGELEHFMAIESDVTEKHEAQLRLQNLASQLIDAQSIGKLACFQYFVRSQDFEWNDQAVDLLGICAVEQRLSFEAFLSRLHREDRPKVREKFQEAIRNSCSANFEFRLIDEVGDLVDFQIRMKPIFDHEGELSHYLGLFQDITERRKAERDLELAMQKAQAGEQAKSEFLAMMSHEIRTPLNGVLGFAEILGTSNLDSQQREHVDLILSSGRMLLEVLNDILDYSKIESSKLDLEFTPFALPNVLHSMTRMMKPLAEKKGLKLECHVDSEVPEFFVGDSGRLQQVLLNLLNNAIKFTEKGKVQIEVRSFQGPNKDPMLRFEVIDSGLGISAEKIGKLFEPFTQGDSSTTRKFGGSGLGLAICRRLVHLMGGKIYVESKSGQGSRFWFEIPVLNADREMIGRDFVDMKPFEKLVACNIEKPRVLLVEDSDVNRRLIRLMLLKVGAEVVEVESAAAALGIVSEAGSSFDLALVDLDLPQMNGGELVQRIKSIQRHETVYAIGISASALEGERKPFLSAGVDSILSKPVSLDLLAEALQVGFEVVRNRRNSTKSFLKNS